MHRFVLSLLCVLGVASCDRAVEPAPSPDLVESSEEDAWLAGPVTTVRGLRLLARALDRGGRPQAMIERTASGRQVACVLPAERWDRLLYRGWTAEVWIEPDRPAAYINLGVARDRQGKYYEAIRAYKEALERDIRQPLVLVNLAHTYMSQDRLKMARQSLEHAVHMDAGLALGHEALGYCLFRSREFDEAERAYKRALECDWRLPRAHAGLGSINMLRFMDDKTHIDLRRLALEHWHRSLELDPDQNRIRDLIARYRPKRESPDAVLLEESPHSKKAD